MDKAEKQLLRLIKLGEGEIKEWQKFVDRLKKELNRIQIKQK